jgi:histidine kinase
VIIIVGVLVLTLSAEFVLPTAFERHMGSMMGGTGMMPGRMMANDLYVNFRSAVVEALIRAGGVAVLAAVGMSIFISRRVVSPVQEMTEASQYIADGHYDKRVDVPDDISPNDLDELEQLAVSFNQMAEKLAQTEKMRQQLIGDISHELRTPLTTIKGSMEGLIDGVLPPDAETYQNIYRNADRLQKLVNDLQELSRVEGDAIPLEIEPDKIESVIDLVVNQLRPQYQEKGVLLKTVIPDNLPRVMIDDDRVAQVLINLLGNALQYTPEGGRVSVSVQRMTDELQVSISDTGVGISPEHIPHIFNRFYRVDKSRSRAGGGSGIGLTIARHLVESHGGRTWAESSGEGAGSKFVFTLPVMPKNNSRSSTNL